MERIDDERLGFVTVAGVETDQDLSIARVFLTSDVDDADLLKAMAAQGEGASCCEAYVWFVRGPAAAGGARTSCMPMTLYLHDHSIERLIYFLFEPNLFII